MSSVQVPGCPVVALGVKPHVSLKDAGVPPWNPPNIIIRCSTGSYASCVQPRPVGLLLAGVTGVHVLPCSSHVSLKYTALAAVQLVPLYGVPTPPNTVMRPLF